MTSRLIGVHQHPVAAFAERLNTRLDEVGQMGLTTMSAAEKRDSPMKMFRRAVPGAGWFANTAGFVPASGRDTMEARWRSRSRTSWFSAGVK
jgi:hypothetical protein